MAGPLSVHLNRNLLIHRRRTVGRTVVAIACILRGRAGRSAHVFITGQPVIAALIESQQLGTGIGDFVGINDAVVVDVQRPHNGRDRRAMMSARAAGTRTILVRTPGRRSVCAIIGWRTTLTAIGRAAGIIAIGTWRRTETATHVFIGGELAVTIFIQGQQLGAGIGDLIGINDTIVIHVERAHDGRDGVMVTTATKTGATLVRTTGRRGVGAVILRGSHEGGRTDGERQH